MRVFFSQIRKLDKSLTSIILLFMFSISLGSVTVTDSPHPASKIQDANVKLIKILFKIPR